MAAAAAMGPQQHQQQQLFALLQQQHFQHPPPDDHDIFKMDDVGDDDTKKQVTQRMLAVAAEEASKRFLKRKDLNTEIRVTVNANASSLSATVTLGQLTHAWAKKMTGEDGLLQSTTVYIDRIFDVSDIRSDKFPRSDQDVDAVNAAVDIDVQVLLAAIHGGSASSAAITLVVNL